ncbi:MAG: putative 4-hydroxybenzoate polyprenyltransferase [Planctomycetes bacterium]|jgi:4-hydroxybenzoate polyprenyltransferase|nr:putative 4-hydroxybenzoate polyprenyltransferase [Planctomycetota bacterium]
MSLLARAVTYGRFVRFSHTVFALPFALMGAVLAAGGIPDLRTLLLLLLAMVGARSAAMAMNRLADAAIDAANPRTKGRELPSGAMSRAEAIVFLAVAAGLFLLACGLLSRLALLLAPAVLLVLLSYPFAKRFTSLCHLWLGAALGLAPVGAWVAVRGEFGEGVLAPVLLGAAVTLWTAGFDVIYALLDVDFDRKKGLFSLPSRLGPGPALALSGLFHAFSVVCLALAALPGGLGAIWFCGVGAAAVLLLVEHRIVRPGDLSRVNTAFFTLNGIVSALLFGVLLLDVLAA